MDVLKILENNYIIYIAFALIIALITLWNIVLSTQMHKLKRKYRRFMRGSAEKSIEQLIREYMESIDNTIDKVDTVSEDVVDLKNQLDRCIQKCHTIRYNAFSDIGSDLSYSIALLDNYNSGVIISSIYGRSESVTYAKPIDNGMSRYPLSLEEELVLDRCLKSNL